MARSIIHGLEIPTLAAGAAIYGGFMMMTWHFDDLPLWCSAPLVAILLAWHSSFQHEIIHGHPTRSRRINTLFGWPPLSLWLPYEVYRDTHLHHHRCKGGLLTHPSRDPESHYLKPGTLARSGRTKRALLWANRTLLGRLIIGPAISIARTWMVEVRRLRAGDAGRAWVWLRHGASAAVVAAWIVAVCHIPLSLYLAAMVYPSISLSLLRSFGEHTAHADPLLRTNVVETNRLLSLLFLNNNLHIVHHAKPNMAWYDLPRAWKAARQDAIAAGILVRPGYRDLVRKHLFRPIIAGEYPMTAAAMPGMIKS